jgi:hypothetical protein
MIIMHRKHLRDMNARDWPIKFALIITIHNAFRKRHLHKCIGIQSER